MVELRLAVFTLGSARVDEILNRKSHALPRDAVVQVLVGLHRDGFIDFTREDATVAPTAEELRHELGRVRNQASTDWLSYGLTAKGGAAWEAVAHPDWSRYIAGLWDVPAERIVEGVAMDRARLEHELLPSLHPLETEETRYFDAVWSREEPWQATYWKTLPFGIRVRARYETRKVAPPPRCSDIGRLRETWRRRAEERAVFTKWYEPAL